MGNIEGLTVLLTRAREDAAAWAEELAGRGARGLVFPCIESRPIRDRATAAKLAAALDGADWLVLASVRGVDGVAELAGAPAVANVSIAAVGAATAAAANRKLGRADLVAPGGTGRDLAEALARRLSDRPSGGAGETSHPARGSIRIVAAGAQNPRRDLEDVLEPLGIEVSRVAVYRTVIARAAGNDEARRAMIADMCVDAIFLASPSAVSGLVARAQVPDGVDIITIGPSTTRAARQAGLRVDGEASQRNLEGMIEAIP